MAEVVEEIAEGFEEAAEVTRSLDTRALGFFAAGVVVGGAIGFAFGYHVCDIRLRTKYEKITDLEIDEMREKFLAKQREYEKVVRGPKPALEDVVAELGYKGEGAPDPVATRYSEVEQRAIDEVEEANEEPETQNVFEAEGAKPTDVWDYATEVKNRVPHLPYIIHIDEFTENTDDYEQISYTFYMQDQVLADVRDEQVDNLEQVVGIDNIKFGHGSEDPNVVYVRNEKLHLDVEISKDEGSYGEQVHGQIRHSATERRVRPIRRFDDE